jgi:hypothetical protein
MEHSESLTNLAPALAKAQKQVKPAIKASTNPFHKSKYADFGAVLDACEDALDDNGLSLIQAPISDESGVGVETMLLHSSGEWIRQRFTLPMAKQDAQAGGSCVTYCRRYSLEGWLRLRREDDDGQAATESQAKALRKKALDILQPAAAAGIKELETAWKAISADMRAVCKEDLQKLKEEAARHANGKAVTA